MRASPTGKLFLCPNITGCDRFRGGEKGLSQYRASVAKTWSEKHKKTWKQLKIVLILHRQQDKTKNYKQFKINTIMKKKSFLVKTVLMSMLTAGTVFSFTSCADDIEIPKDLEGDDASGSRPSQSLEARADELW